MDSYSERCIWIGVGTCRADDVFRCVPAVMGIVYSEVRIDFCLLNKHLQSARFNSDEVRLGLMSRTGTRT